MSAGPWRRETHKQFITAQCYLCSDKRMCVQAPWEDRGGSDSFSQVAEDGFTGRDSEAGFRSLGRALPGREDEVGSHPGSSGKAPPKKFGNTRRLTGSWISISRGIAIELLQKMDLVRKCISQAPTMCQALA